MSLPVTKVLNIKHSTIVDYVFNLNSELNTCIDIIITTYQTIRFRGLKAGSNTLVYVLKKKLKLMI